MSSLALTEEADAFSDCCNASALHGWNHLRNSLRFSALHDKDAEFPRSLFDKKTVFSADEMPALPFASPYGIYNAGFGPDSPVFSDAFNGAAQKRFHSNQEEDSAELWPPEAHVYSTDEFRMYEFKVKKCMQVSSHDWTECPFAHPEEKARRRDPRKFHYSGTPCPDFRKGGCNRGDTCEYAHGVFECWLHPSRYRTQPCKDGRNCRRRVCFFAHTPEQLRLSSGSSPLHMPKSRGELHFSVLKSSHDAFYDGSPMRQALSAFLGPLGSFEDYLSLVDECDSSTRKNCPTMECRLSQVSSPTSTLIHHSHSPSFTPPNSPPISPSGSLNRHQGGRFLIQPSSTQSSSHPVMLPQGQGSVIPSVTGPRRASSFSSVVRSHRRQLDRRISLPSAFQPSDIAIPGSSLCKTASSNDTMNDLMAAIQHLELNNLPDNNLSSVASLSPRVTSLAQASNFPVTPRKLSSAVNWDAFDSESGNLFERVESGRDLRAKIYGRLSSQNPLEKGSPDLDWMNELFKCK